MRTRFTQSTPTEQPQADGGELHEHSTPKELREHAERQAAKATAAEERAAKFEQKAKLAAFAEAGFDLSNQTVGFVAKHFDGDIDDIEAVREYAAAAGLASAGSTAPTPPEGEATLPPDPAHQPDPADQERERLQQSATPPPRRDDDVDWIAAGQEESQRILQQGGSRREAAVPAFASIFAAHAAGDPRAQYDKGAWDEQAEDERRANGGYLS